MPPVRFPMVAIVAFGLVAVKPVITIQLEPKSPSFSVGEQVLFRAITTNVSDQPLLLIPQGDSSQSGRKAPMCQIQIRGADGNWVVPSMPPGCGNTNPIREADFVEVAPRKAIDLLGGMAWSVYELSESFKTPGTYEVRLRYDTTRPIDAWLGGPLVPEQEASLRAKVAPLFERVPKGVFISNVVKITLKPAPPRRV